MDSTDQLHWPKGDFGPCTDVYFQAGGGGQKKNPPEAEGPRYKDYGSPHGKTSAVYRYHTETKNKAVT